MYDRLVSGDRPSILALGVYGAESLKRAKMAVFMVDVLGRVHIMPPHTVEVLVTPKVSRDELNKMSEDDAISVMTRQGDGDDLILDYLKARTVVVGEADGGQDL
jgi:hypothetical protein